MKKINGRAKGQNAERKLAKLFATWWGGDFARTPLSGGFATSKFREDWNACGDLVTPDPTFPFCVESKKVEGWSLEQMLTSNKTKLHAWWEQTVKETPKGKIPLLVFTKNHAPLYAMMSYADATVCINHTDGFIAVVNDFRVLIFPLSKLLSTTKGNWQYGR